MSFSSNVLPFSDPIISIMKMKPVKTLEYLKDSPLYPFFSSNPLPNFDKKIIEQVKTALSNGSSHVDCLTSIGYAFPFQTILIKTILAIETQNSLETEYKVFFILCSFISWVFLSELNPCNKDIAIILDMLLKIRPLTSSQVPSECFLLALDMYHLSHDFTSHELVLQFTTQKKILIS